MIYIYICVCVCTLQHIYMHSTCIYLSVRPWVSCSLTRNLKFPVPATPFNILFAFSPQQLKPQRPKYLLMRSAGKVVDKRSTAPTCPPPHESRYICIYIYIYTSKMIKNEIRCNIFFQILETISTAKCIDDSALEGVSRCSKFYHPISASS